MAFDYSNFSKWSTGEGDTNKLWSYSSADDAVATIAASGYFNDVTAVLSQHDVIFVRGSDDNLMYEVSSATGAATVTVVEYSDPASSISLLQGNILLGNASAKAAAFDAKTDTAIMIGNGTTITSAILSNHVSMANNGAVTIANDVISKDMLTAGIKASHMVVYAGEHTTAGGAASESITVSGVLATDLVHVTMHTDGATPRTILQASASSDSIDIEFSGDPSTDHVVTYSVLRATS